MKEKKNAVKKLKAPETLPALPLPARTALPCSWYTTGRRLAPPVTSSYLYGLCYLEAGHTVPLQGSFPCDETFWGLFNLCGAARTPGGKEGSTVFKYIFFILGCVGFPWPSGYSAGLGDSGS